MRVQTRRRFLRYASAGSVWCGFLPAWRRLLGAERPDAQGYDLLVKGGRVVDPSQDLSAPRDVAIVGGKVSRVAPDIDASTARRVLDASGKIVTPGLIVVHVHV